MSFLLTNLIIFLAHYILVNRFKIENLSGKFVCVFILSAAQIVLTELLLGISRQLYLHNLILLNFSISLTITYAVFKRSDNHFYEILKRDLTTLRHGLKSIACPPNIFLILLTIVITTWFILASSLLPPRGVDDFDLSLSAYL